MLKVKGASSKCILDIADWLLIVIMGDVNPANMDVELRKKLAELENELAEGLSFGLSLLLKALTFLLFFICICI